MNDFSCLLHSHYREQVLIGHSAGELFKFHLYEILIKYFFTKKLAPLSHAVLGRESFYILTLEVHHDTI